MHGPLEACIGAGDTGDVRVHHVGWDESHGATAVLGDAKPCGRGATTWANNEHASCSSISCNLGYRLQPRNQIRVQRTQHDRKVSLPICLSLLCMYVFGHVGPIAHAIHFLIIQNRHSVWGG